MAEHDGYVMIVDDDPSVVEAMARILSIEEAVEVRKAYSGAQALRGVEDAQLNMVLLDLGLPDVSGETVLRRFREARPEVPVVVVTAINEVTTAVQCMAAGAHDYVVKGSEPERLMASVRNALAARRRTETVETLKAALHARTVRKPAAFASIKSRNDGILSLFPMIETVAPTREPVLITGETGVGKELFARAVHEASGRIGAFVAANLAGVDDTMVADTLFGHRPGAFTGASEVRAGLIAAAEGGTLFLDEIGEIGAATQVKLLRLIENGEYYPLGSDVPRHSNARIVAATNRDLSAAVRDGEFRRDLLYRLAVFEVHIPPLRRRLEDIALLVEHWYRELGGPSAEGPALTAAALRLLERYPFPGNVRELRSVVVRARALCGRWPLEEWAVRSALERADASAAVLNSDAHRLNTIGIGAPVEAPGDASDALAAPPLPTIKNAIRELIDEALRRSGGRQNAAAAMLGISPQALSKRLRASSSLPGQSTYRTGGST